MKALIIKSLQTITHWLQSSRAPKPRQLDLPLRF